MSAATACPSPYDWLGQYDFSTDRNIATRSDQHNIKRTFIHALVQVGGHINGDIHGDAGMRAREPLENIGQNTLAKVIRRPKPHYT